MWRNKVGTTGLRGPQPQRRRRAGRCGYLCVLTGRSRATRYSRPKPARPAPIRQAEWKAPTQALSPAECAQVLKVINSEAYAALSIGQVWDLRARRGPLLVLAVEHVPHCPQGRADPGNPTGPSWNTCGKP